MATVRKFSNAPRNNKFQVVKIKLCDYSSIIVRFREVIQKWVEVPDFLEGQVEYWAKYQEIPILTGLRQGNFSSLSLTY